MEKLVLGILATIAGVFAIVLFGKPQGPASTQSDAPIGQVEPSPKLSEPTRSEPTRSEPTLNETPITTPSPQPTVSEPPSINDRPTTPNPAIAIGISTPVTSLPADFPAFDPKSDADAVRAARTGDRSTASTAVEPLAPRPTNAVNSTAVNSTAVNSMPSGTATTGLARSMPPFAAIQDPKRPSTPELQDLSQEIINLGRSQKRSNLNRLLQHRTHEDALIRGYVAYAMGQLASAGSQSDKQSIIPFLQELAQDPDRDVQQIAGKVLKQMQPTAQGV